MKYGGLLVATLAACAPATSTDEAAITTAVRHERFGLIRDSAAEMGLYNASLLAGVAISETNLAHCQSEATFACMGPASPSCNGGPVIAGAADGPCSAMQGGLGMFQFDSGTYQDTINTYGDSILTIEGNTAQAVNFVEVRAIQDKHATDWLSAMDWLNNVQMQTGTMTLEEWADFIVCRYNGCCTTSATCSSRRSGYRDNALKAFDEMGAEFWDTSGRCAGVPAGGVIDQRSECYIAGGDPRYWRREPGGYGANGREWTGTTSAAAPANFGMWIIKVPAGRYPVDVYLDGGEVGTSVSATYKIVHAGVTDTVTVDQTSVSGWVNLGDFDFAGAGDEHVLLGDNTGEAGSMDRHVMFDALRVPIDDSEVADGGCCGTGRGTGATSLVGVGLFALALRRRRR
ncbi:MAG TPA: hypothetical protein VMZ53_23695 [Kofleriaceae bacterium]|nr:hypothetical protein [Kofleriaceae bacterium]